uniref:Uncharacterized protein n=1 Tax=Nonomuraea gerenzanensis TaxID=93944 RepID=A0A1M4EC35_9ACTN|nr:hypothetical protein BN4615_P5689 [Nonomuraea gerenzanensis]
MRGRGQGEGQDDRGEARPSEGTHGAGPFSDSAERLLYRISALKIEPARQRCQRSETHKTRWLNVSLTRFSGCPLPGRPCGLRAASATCWFSK